MPNLSHIKGQSIAKRMMVISCRNPSSRSTSVPTGKSMLADSVVDFMPPLSYEEALTTTKVYSNAKLLGPNEGLIRKRPVRKPHHSTSLAGLVGGGNPILPGEITLATNGVLILDELLEFNNRALQALREPLESQTVVIVRANQRILFPASFLLIATTNLCPCGHLGNPYHLCICTRHQINRYQKKLVGPFLDRIDLFAYLHPLEHEDYDSQDENPFPNFQYEKLWQKNGLLTAEEIRNIRLSSSVKYPI